MTDGRQLTSQEPGLPREAERALHKSAGQKSLLRLRENLYTFEDVQRHYTEQYSLHTFGNRSCAFEHTECIGTVGRENGALIISSVVSFGPRVNAPFNATA